MADKLRQNTITSIAITTTLYVSAFPIMEIVDFIRTYNHTAKIIVGGPFISTKVRTLDEVEVDYLFQTVGADYYVNSSQGEGALGEIIASLKENRPPAPIKNTYYKTGEGYVKNPVARENNRLSENIVDWGLFSDQVGEHVAVRTSISCPFSCSFCGFPEHAGAYQTAGVDIVEQELDRLQRLKQVKYINFIDDTFNVPVERFKSILRMMIKNDYGFKWHSYFRCQYADEEMIELMKESGCEGVFLGIESGSETILKNMNKGADIGQYAKGIKLLKEHGIVTYGNFIIGFPGETVQTVEETIKFIEANGLDFYRAQLWYCEHITPIWKEKEKYNIEGESFVWSHATMDSDTAAGFVEQIFLSIKNSVWVPQYNFDLCSIWHLKHQGMEIKTIKNFIKSFNNGISEKLTNPSRKEAGVDVLRQIKNFRQGDNGSHKLSDSRASKKVKTGTLAAEFSF
ncbi:MAG: radical SAM protein [bacterium]|nr:radical SAM protein [bacterium]